MRIVATSDTHYPVDIAKWIPDGDVFIHAGDLMRSGYPDEWPPLLEWLAALPHKIKLFVPGNHDLHLMNYPGPALQDMRKIGVIVLGLPGNDHYCSYKLENGKSVLGLPYVTGLPRWAFNSSEKEISEHLVKMGRHDIIVSHAPVYAMLDEVGGMKAGIHAYRNYLYQHKPTYWINGHIHEAYGTREDYGCKFYNVALCNRDYIHANAPAVIDL